MVRGDWVLFHPVYSSEELKAVKASRLILIKTESLTD